MDSVYEKILEYVQGLEIIDTHEHLPSNEHIWLSTRREEHYDVFKEYLSHYFSADLVSAGLPRHDLTRVRDADLPVLQKWDMVEPVWEVARHTGYGRALDLAVRGIYGLNGISRTTIEAVNAAFLASLKPGHFRRVLHDLSHIRVSLLDDIEEGLDSIEDFFKPVFRLDSFVLPGSHEKIRFFERLTGIRMTSLDDWCECCRNTLDIVLRKGVIALKCGLAYHRPLRFERTPHAAAEAEFHDFLTAIKPHDDRAQIPVLGVNCQNYMMHYILELANQRGLVYQFHTGLQEGFGNHVAWTDPSLMTNLFMEYPEVRFDLFHLGYPFQQKVSALAKNFANVFIDMCWAHIISPTASIAALVEYLDAVPFNKISAFGGDYLFVDGVYGHQQLARENVSKALAIKVRDGVFGVDRAKEIAHALFYTNPARLFQLA